MKDLTVNKHVAIATQNQAMNALVFLSGKVRKQYREMTSALSPGKKANEVTGGIISWITA